MVHQPYTERNIFVEVADQAGLILLVQAEILCRFADEFTCALALFVERGDPEPLRGLYEITREAAIRQCLREASLMPAPGRQDTE